MLVSLQCDKFMSHGEVRAPLVFHAGLNAVLGDDNGSNSIGKSTFLMVLDFVFGGDDYVKKCTDVQENVKGHTIKFAFEFDSVMYYFTRNTIASAKKFMTLVKRLGSLYTRSGAVSRIDSLDITDLQLPSGAKLRLQIDGAEAKDIKQLDEFFQVFAEAVKVSAETDIELVIENPNDEDALVKELKK